MSTVRQAIASTAVYLIKSAFAGEYSPGSHLRVAGFQRDEVSEMITLLTGWSPWEGHPANLLVTTSQPWEGLPSSAIVMSGEVTATGLRNQTEPVVYFEQDAYADRQGLKKVWRITDRDVLEATGANGTARSVLERELWRQARSGHIPEVLAAVFDEAWASLAPKKGEIDLRTWARFVAEVCRAAPSVVTTQEAWTRVGEQLRVLQMFPDDLLVEASPTERSRRLRRNWRSSRFVTESADEAALDELRERLDAVTLEEPNGDATPLELAAQLKDRFRRLLGSSRDPERKELWFRYWEQIESRKSKKKGLGQQVAEQITRRAPERRDELDALDVIEGLDAREQESAIRFLDAVPLTTLSPLSSLLTPPLLRAVMKVADPSQRVTKQPLRKILREIQQMVQERLAERNEPGQIRLERMRRGTSSQVSDEASAALFAFIYGPTLRSIADHVKGEAITLECDRALTDAAAFDAIRARLDKEDVRDDDEVDELGWDPLRLQLRWADDTAGRASFEWRSRDLPGLAMLARVVSRPDIGRWTGAEGHSFDDWVEGAFDQGSLEGEAASGEIAKELPSAWTSRIDYLSAIAERGLVPEDLDLYVRGWAEALDHLRCSHRPEGNPDPLVSEFLRLDTWDGHDGSLAILAHHPLRLRWIAAHFHEMQKLIVMSLRGDLKLNEVNEGLFFDRLERASPRAHPPVLVLDQQQFVAVRESDWHEILHVARDTTGLRRDWLAELDDHAIDSAAELIGKYVEAYPHKADGLHLLTLVRPGSSGSIVRALKAVRSALGKLGGRRLELVLSVFAPVEELIRLERALQVFDSDDRRAESEFPAIRVRWHPWDSDQDVLPDLAPVSSDVDVALIPNLFGSRVEASESTEIRSGTGAAFAPWIDPTTTTSGDSKDGTPLASVSRRLVPEGHDEVLEHWSTVNVRQFRSKAVSGTDADRSTDFFEFRVPFAQGARFFSDLHAKAHWVLTLDPFVGREQIEALENGPDVITVRTRVGTLGTHGLVVSSRAGRDFVVKRLERRLAQQLPAQLATCARLFSNRVYDHARALVPGILLRALGLGRTAQEMVGLVVARRRVREELPANLGDSGFEAWLSLDEHADWFASTRARADLVRIIGRWDSGRLALDVLVVEAKFREQVDLARAEEQIDESIRLFRDALAVENAKPDAAIWRRVIVDGIRRVTKGGRHRFAREALQAVWMNKPSADLPLQIRDALIAGTHVAISVEGVLCTLPDGNSLDGSARTPGGHRWIRTSVSEIGAILQRLDEPPEDSSLSAPTGGSAPDDSAGPDVSTHGRTGAVGQTPTGQSAVASTAGASSDQANAVASGNTERLRARCQRVIDILAAHGINATPDPEEPAGEGPAFYFFRVQLPKGVTPKAVHKLTEELQYGLQLPAGRIPRSYTDRGAVVIEVPKEDSERVPVFAQDLWTTVDWPSDRLLAPIGVDARFNPIGVDFSSSKSPHLLIGGMTGGGKSVALETILRGLLTKYPPTALRVFIVDPKGTEFAALEGDPHIEGRIGMDAEDAITILQSSVAEMERRYRTLKEQGVRDIGSFNAAVSPELRLPWHVVVLDEYADLTSEREAKKEIERLVQQLAQKARASGIHVIVATQKPSVEVISSTTRSNLGAQLALRVKNATDSRVLMDDVGAESLAGNGDAFLRLSGAEPVRIQCALYRP